MINTWKTGLAALALASLPLVSACGKEESNDLQTATKDDGTLTLAAALGANDDLGTLREAIGESELSGVLDGSASYTVLAPSNEAFEALGEESSTLLEAEQRPVLVAILRDHLLPGHLTPEAIGEAIEQNGGPVTMATLGEADVTFFKTGDNLTVAMEDGGTATFSGTAIAANNGVVIPIDTVLLPPKG
ncbi:fasciclin domain-containing protein [Qipengyuania qiaonensis]|uniref:Fasciclin domain-containing protein n=1 Tax=Qipengyuania qiaonensis TaxID=2867240 RepID=A0ABS7J7G6_9SPHN|nr:fasciclin domain-containing protein [Qipengyuania qiaonensis]MBX7483265.1 fasciclin domain-containing protein [Qipengyuania qiaonensis]